VTTCRLRSREADASFRYVNPIGIADIVGTSVDGLFKEFSAATGTPVR